MLLWYSPEVLSLVINFVAIDFCGCVSHHFFFQWINFHKKNFQKFCRHWNFLKIHSIHFFAKNTEYFLPIFYILTFYLLLLCLASNDFYNKFLMLLNCSLLYAYYRRSNDFKLGKYHWPALQYLKMRFKLFLILYFCWWQHKFKNTSKKQFSGYNLVWKCPNHLKRFTWDCHFKISICFSFYGKFFLLMLAEIRKYLK